MSRCQIWAFRCSGSSASTRWRCRQCFSSDRKRSRTRSVAGLPSTHTDSLADLPAPALSAVLLLNTQLQTPSLTRTCDPYPNPFNRQGLPRRHHRPKAPLARYLGAGRRERRRQHPDPGREEGGPGHRRGVRQLQHCFIILDPSQLCSIPRAPSILFLVPMLGAPSNRP